MARFSVTFSLCMLLALGAFTARAGDEDEKKDAKKQEAKAPEDTKLPEDADAPAMSMGSNDEPTPDYEDVKPAAPKVKRPRYKEKDLDENMDYSRLVDAVEVADPTQGVLPPALGFRGYRPNMIAAGAGDRTPGFGGLIEYSWNRIAAGVFASYLNTKGEDKIVASYGFAGLYGLYRWLPFDISPYFLMGVEIGSKTDESFGGVLGLGMEARIYSGWTAFLGWTHHSTVHRGYIGGGIGWSF